ncbi:pitrilysin family protein [Cesiribacter sp. SM1]|uniref:M16 family metallopeptidase n=1 Tax=Cesiribacter sp. SM1 TaxID=2861196 RepID=UPI001CD31169|nr:pitrilysin family protein [Cesiribacter sp. SM1]
MQDFYLHELSNGIRVVHKQVVHTKIVHCGFVLDIGSRDELPYQMGLAHFWEHMAFKGTLKRKAYHILNRLDSVGGELNAYTTKEKICFYASVLDQYLENALELLTDITFHSTFPEKQIEKERGVILEEMSMYEDSPEDALQDIFDSLVFPDHPLGHNILGTTETLNSFQRQHFLEFVQQNLDTGRLIFSCVGNISPKKAIRLAEKYLGNLPVFKAERQRRPFDGYKPVQQELERSIMQAHFSMGRPAFALRDEQRLPFFMLTNILGGPANTSRLNMALREKKGFVYNVDASYTPYTDTGLFSISFATEPGQLQKSIRLVEQEFRKLCDKPLGTLQLHAAQEQLIGQLAMAEENNASLMLMMGKSILDMERIESLEDIFARIRKISASELQYLAQEMLQPQSFSSLTLKPAK